MGISSTTEVLCNGANGSAGMSFSLNNGASTDGAWGFNDDAITARITGYDDGRLMLVGGAGITMMNTAYMNGNNITGLAPGAVAVSSTDAVNGSQLYNTANSVTAALGGGTTVGKDGTITAPSYVLGDGTYTDVGSALEAINTATGNLANASKYIKVVSTADEAMAGGTESIAIGGAALATGDNSLAIGSGATAAYDNSIAIGVNAKTDAPNTLSVGRRGAEMRITNVADGIDTSDAATVGQLGALHEELTQQTSGMRALLMDPSALLDTAPVTNYIAVSPNVTGGTETSASNHLNAMAIGPTSAASGINALAVGAGSAAAHHGTTAVGSNAGALSVNSTVVGTGATVGALSDNSLSIGYNARSINLNATAIGSFASASATGSVAIGYNVFVTPAATNAMAIGANASVSQADSIALGYNSFADRGNAVSVGNTSTQRQIIHVAAGTKATDAVNVGQLSGVTAALGGGAAVTSTGAIQAPAYTVGGQTYSDVGSAIAAAASEGTANAVQYDTSARNKVTLGGTSSTTPVTLSNVAAGVANTDAVNLAQLKEMGANVDSSGNVTNSFVAYDDTTLGAITLKGASGTKISGLAAGTLSAASTDAVNGAQLFQTNQDVANVAGDVANVGNTVNNIVNGGGIKYFHTNSTLADSSATGKDAVAIGGAASATAANSVALGSNSVASRANTVDVGSRQITGVANGTQAMDAVNLSQLQAMGANIDGNGTVTNTFVAYDDSTRSKVTFGSAGSTQPVTLSNVAAGVANTDAVNLAQLKEMGANVDSNGNVTNSFVAYDDTTLGTITLKGASGTKISGLAAGTLSAASTDAVNGAQLFQTNQDVANVAGDVANVGNTVNNIVNGGGIKYFHTNSTLADSSATGKDAVAIGGAASATAANSVALGSNSVANRANTVDVGSRQITGVANGTQAMDAVNLSQLQAMGANIDGNGTVTNTFVAYDDSTRSKVTFGGAGSTTPVTLSNVAAGVANTDAVNLAQLKEMGANVDNSGNVTNRFVAYDDTTLGTITLKGASGTKISGLAAGTLSAMSTDAVNGAQLFQTNQDVANVAGDVANVGSTVNNIVNGGGIKYFHTNSTLADSSATGKDAVAIGGAASATAANSVALGSNSVASRANTVDVGSRQITGVANGTQAMDAVNLSQLQAMGANIDGNGTVTNTFVAYDDSTRSKVTFGGVSTSKPVTLSNVAAGVANTDAVNLSQLKEMGANVDSSGNVTNSFVAYDDTTLGTITLKGASGTKITDLAAGTLSATSMDAVNGTQLFQTNQDVANVSSTVNNIVNGGGIKYFHANSTLADSSATGKDAVAIGGAASATAANSVALGSNSVASRANTVDVGSRQITGVAKGTQAMDAVNLSQLQAMGANIDGNGTVTNTFVAYDDSTRSKVTFGGAGSTQPVTLSNVAAGVANTDAVNLAQLKEMGANVDSSGNVTNSFVAYDDTTLGTITLKGAGGTKISGLAAGTLSATSTDAVNGAQLFQTNQDVANVAGDVSNVTNTVNNIANGGGIKYFHTNSTLADSSATGKDAVAIGGAASATAANSVALGSNSVASRANTVDVGSRQITGVAKGTQAMDAVNLSQLQAMGANIDDTGTVTNTFVAYDDSTRSKVTFGGAGSTTPVTLSNVAAGVANTDAVNLAQLKEMGANVDSNGNVTNSFVAYDDTTLGTITLKGASGTKISGLAAGTLSAASTDAVNGAQLFQTNQDVANVAGDVANVAGDVSNVTNTVNNIVNGGGIKYFHTNSTLADSSATGKDAVAIGGAASATAANSVALGSNSVANRANTVDVGSRQITGVANGTQAMDAVNLSQLQAMGANIDGTGTVTNAFVAYDDSTRSKVTFGGVGLTTPVLLSNLAAGQVTSTSRDAVNGSQLYSTASSVAAALGGGSAVGPDGRVTAPSYVIDNGQTFNDVGSAISDLDNQLVQIINQNATTQKYIKIVSTANSAVASGIEAVAIGGNSYATGDRALAIGAGASAIYANSTAIGVNAKTDAPNTLSVGSRGAEMRITNVADGINATDAATVAQLDALQAQLAQQASGTKSLLTDPSQLIGAAPVTNYIAVSSNVTGGTETSTTNDLNAMAIGPASAATGIDALAVGAGSGAAHHGTTAVGSRAGALSVNSTVIGTDATVGAFSDGSVSIGYNSRSIGLNATVIGTFASASSAGSVAIGYNTFVHPSAINGMAIGQNASVSAAGGVAIGANSVADRANVVSVGNSTQQSQIINVAGGTQDTDAVNVRQLKALGASVDSSGNVTGAFVAYDSADKGQVTFGGIDSTIPVLLSNVAAGQVSATSTQAVNGSQLFNTASGVAAALGGGSSVTANGQVTKPAYVLNGGTYSDVGSALDAIDSIASTGSANGVVYDSTARDKLTLGGTNATTPVEVSNVAAGTADNDAVNVRQLKDAGLNIDTAGNVTNSFVAYDDSGKGAVTFGGLGSTTPVTLKNVAAGIAATDAVNVGQMESYVNTAVGSSGAGTANAVAYDDSTKSQVTLGGVGSTTPVTLTNLAAGTSATDAVNYSQLSALESAVNNLANGGAGDTTYVNIGSPSTGGTAAAASGTDAIAIGNGASASGDSAIAIGAHTTSSGDRATAMGAGSSATGATSTAIGSNASATGSNAVAVGAGSVADRDNSVSVGFQGAERQITNVAAGTQATDAVNLGQLNNAVSGLNSSIDNVDRSAAKGIASASALNIVTPYLPGRTTLNAGVATYRGYQALGIGVSRWNEKGTINYNLGASSSGGNSTIVRAGIGIVLGN